MASVVGRVAPLVALVLSLVMASCSLLPDAAGRAAQTPVASPGSTSSAPPSSAASSAATPGFSTSTLDWGSVGSGWMVILLQSTVAATTRVVLHSPEGTSFPLADLPAGAELWDVTLGVGQILIALPGTTKGAKSLTVLDPRKNSRLTVPGEFTKAQFFQSGEGRLLLWRVGAKNWALVDLAGKVIDNFPDLTGDTVVADSNRQLILGTSPRSRQLVLIDRVTERSGTTLRATWDRGASDCRPAMVYWRGGDFLCTFTQDGSAVLAAFTPGERPEYYDPKMSAKRGQQLSLHPVGDDQWAFVQKTGCGGSTLALGDYWGGKPVRGFDRSTAPFLVQKSGVHVLVSPVCGKPPTRIEQRDYRGGAKLLYTPPAGWTILAAKAMPTFL